MAVDILSAVIEEARRRQRRRRILVLAASALLLSGLLAYALAGRGGSNRGTASSSKHATTPHALPRVQPAGVTSHLIVVSGSSGTSGWFRGELPIFFRPRQRSDVIPADLLKRHDRLPSLLSGFSRLKGDLGQLLLRDSRAIQVRNDSIYLVPTSTRGVCALSSTSFGCLPTLNRQGISWSLEGSGNDGAVFVGAVASFVAEIDLVFDSGRLRATMVGGLFSLAWPVQLSPDPFLNLNPRFVIRYRDGRPPATISLRSP